MSALSVPNLLSTPAKPASQNSNSQPEADTPFSSVLQQKVQSGKDSSDSKTAAETATPQPAGEPAAQAPADPAANGTSPETPVAATVVNGEYAQTALQQLLPWLQNLQNQDSKTSAPAELLASSDGLLPQVETLPVAVMPAVQADIRPDLSKQLAVEGEELASGLLKNSSESASATANLAAPTEALIGSGNKHKNSQEGFETALQQANDHLNTQQATQASNGNGAARSTEPTRLQAPLGTPQWQNELGDRVHLMSRQNEGRAELVLTPPQLGRIEVTLNVNGDQASALFVSANPEVRAALEGAMDRLREVLANSGISLGQAQVGAESSGQSAHGESGNGRQGGQMAGNNGTDAVAATAWTRHSNNMLDVFA